MIIAAAQTKPDDGKTAHNLEDHIRMACRAAEEGAAFIIFPELSLTGYQKEGAAALALSINDTRLSGLKATADTCNIIIAAGAPVILEDNLYIGMFVIQPAPAPVLLYTKQYLHAGEELFFTPSFQYNPVLLHDQEKIAFAICADISNPAHAETAHQNGATLYAAGIFYTPGGIADGYANLATYARTHHMPVLMSNYCGTSYRLPAAGMSAFWNEKGQLTGSLVSHKPGILLISGQKFGWAAKEIYDI